jgi:hypothetical protein
MQLVEQSLLDRLRDGEDPLIERKPQSVKTDDLRRTFVAFANSVPDGNTAVLFIGVSDEGQVLGVDNPDEMQKRVIRARNDCYPAIKLQPYELTISGKRIVAVEIPPSSQRPHFAGIAYVRRGSQSIEASAELYNELLSTHCSVVGQILKWKGKFITVRVQGTKLGSHYPPIHDPGYRATYHCKVVTCTPGHVELTISGYEHVAVPLTSVTLDWDVPESRLCLQVREH